MRKKSLVAVLAVLISASALAGDVTINSRVEGVTTYSSEGNSSSVSIGDTGGATARGVTVINGAVTIDGVTVPASVKRHKSKAGVVYLIERTKRGVFVTAEGASKTRVHVQDDENDEDDE